MELELGEQAITLITVGSAAGVALLAIVVLTLALRLRRVRRTVAAAATPTPAPEVTPLYGDDSAMAEHVRRLDTGLAQMQTDLLEAVSRVGVVRYDAFGDSGGALSFSVAILDGNASGVVFTGLNARAESRCYAKTLRHGEADVELSPEEQHAVQAARTRPAGSVAVASPRRRRAS